MTLWIDADACPRAAKDLVYKTAYRLKVRVVLVANSGMEVPRSTLISQVVVGKELDAADDHILEQATPGDLVVTQDIPLAAKLVDRKIVTLNPRGTVYTASNVKEALATRDLMQDLREAGTHSGGPPPYGAKDRERFANALDRELTRLRRTSGA